MSFTALVWPDSTSEEGEQRTARTLVIRDIRICAQHAKDLDDRRGAPAVKMTQGGVNGSELALSSSSSSCSPALLGPTLSLLDQRLTSSLLARPRFLPPHSCSSSRVLARRLSGDPPRGPVSSYRRGTSRERAAIPIELGSQITRCKGRRREVDTFRPEPHHLRGLGGKRTDR